MSGDRSNDIDRIAKPGEQKKETKDLLGGLTSSDFRHASNQSGKMPETSLAMQDIQFDKPSANPQEKIESLKVLPKPPALPNIDVDSTQVIWSKKVAEQIKLLYPNNQELQDGLMQFFNQNYNQLFAKRFNDISSAADKEFKGKETSREIYKTDRIMTFFNDMVKANAETGDVRQRLNQVLSTLTREQRDKLFQEASQGGVQPQQQQRQLITNDGRHHVDKVGERIIELTHDRTPGRALRKDRTPEEEAELKAFLKIGRESFPENGELGKQVELARGRYLTEILGGKLTPEKEREFLINSRVDLKKYRDMPPVATPLEERNNSIRINKESNLDDDSQKFVKRARELREAVLNRGTIDGKRITDFSKLNLEDQIIYRVYQEGYVRNPAYAELMIQWRLHDKFKDKYPALDKQQLAKLNAWAIFPNQNSDKAERDLYIKDKMKPTEMTAEETVELDRILHSIRQNRVPRYK